MKLLDVLLGRTKPGQPDLDTLFALPAAGQVLEDEFGFEPTGTGAVCFKAAEGQDADQSGDAILDLLTLEQGADSTVVRDEFGFIWAVCHRVDADLTMLMTRLHGVNRTLSDAGFGPSLLCTVVGFACRGDAGGQRRLGLVYLFKRGTVYPFAPVGDQRRDTALELRVRGALATSLPVEPDLERWFPLWNAPVP